MGLGKLQWEYRDRAYLQHSTSEWRGMDGCFWRFASTKTSSSHHIYFWHSACLKDGCASCGHFTNHEGSWVKLTALKPKWVSSPSFRMIYMHVYNFIFFIIFQHRIFIIVSIPISVQIKATCRIAIQHNCILN